MTIALFFASLFALLATLSIGAAWTLRRRLGAATLRTQELELLAEMSELLQLSSSADEALALLPRYGARLFSAFAGAAYIVRTSPGELELAASWSPLVEAGTGRFLTFPMHAAGESMGVLTLSGPIALANRSCAERFTNQVGLALANLRRLEALRTRAVRDPLTGLFNRRYMEEALVRELLRGERTDGQVGVIVTDVDHFKRYNDTWGHAGGDALLRQLARVMETVFAGDDVVCRYGGEEFVIVVPNTTPGELYAVAERLRAEVKEMYVRIDGRVLGAVTLSAGIAVSPQHGTTVEALIAAADRALYAAKSGGRDLVAIPPPEAFGRDAA